MLKTLLVLFFTCCQLKENGIYKNQCQQVIVTKKRIYDKNENECKLMKSVVSYNISTIFTILNKWTKTNLNINLVVDYIF